ncbi:MAG: hypothetical protein SFX73_13150 [Kofleriaceae bacterium]|nr:hypothetical protein [Kofleriaceae bacterium]
MAEASGTTAKIAIALSLVAVVTVGMAVVVVATRDAPAAAQTEPPRSSTVPRDDEQHTVRAIDVVRLDRDNTEAVRGGIKVTDHALRGALVLEAGDVITSISGRSIERQFDVFDALAGASMMNATTLYIELERGGARKLVRWRLDGDLRAARKAALSR